ncbi:MAG TPA: phytoene/squalene synthase family protein [Xanthobacteraceae bacterium]|nr:phytoene/squalene synthase family protein [Xanthobacteraceae bacterium]
MTAMLTEAEQSAAAFCADQVRTFDFPRYATTLFTSPERRRSLLALYAFGIEIARVREHVSQPLPGEIRLQWWLDALSGEGHGNVTDNPVAGELLHAIEACHLPVAPLIKLIEAHRFDLYDDAMPSMPALEAYFNDAIAPLFDLAGGILGHRSDLVAHLAQHAAIGNGYADILMRLPAHASRRQMFLPEDVMHEHGAKAEEVFAGRTSPELFAVIDHLAGEAVAHLNSAAKVLQEAPRDVRPAFLQLPLLRRQLDAMARAKYDPFHPVPASRLGILWGIWRAARAA